MASRGENSALPYSKFQVVSFDAIGIDKVHGVVEGRFGSEGATCSREFPGVNADARIQRRTKELLKCVPSWLPGRGFAGGGKTRVLDCTTFHALFIAPLDGRVVISGIGGGPEVAKLLFVSGLMSRLARRIPPPPETLRFEQSKNCHCV